MRDRIHSIDTLRAIAIFFIVIGHVQPFRGFESYGNYVYFILDTIGQFDVPFFFVTSGYFLAVSLRSKSVKSAVSSAGRKLGSIYLFGRILSVTAALGIALFVGNSVRDEILTHGLGNLTLLDFVYYGNAIAVPLWFLTALFFAIVFVSCFVKFGKTRYLLPVAAFIHVVGLIGTNFEMLMQVPFRTRDALFFGFFYVALGYTINTSDWKPDKDRSHLYLGAVVALFAVQLFEQYAIGYIIRDNVLSQGIYMTEYTFSTVFFVLAIFAYALSNPRWGKDTILPKVGRHALGIYLLHVPVFRIIHATKSVWLPATGIDLTSTLLWQLGLSPVVYVLSLATYLLLARMNVIELDGSHTPWLSRLMSQGGGLRRKRHSDNN
jgi:surface polysaccharide O-acyltransferase-like enzyme